MADEERPDQPEGQEPENEGTPGGAAEESAPEEQAADGPSQDDAPAEGAPGPDTGNGEEPAPEEVPAAESGDDAPAAESADDAPAADAADDAPAADAGDEAPAADAGEAAPAAESADDAPAPAGDEAPAADAEGAAREGGEQPRQRGGRGREQGQQQEDVIPGAHLEPDLVLEEQQRQAAEGGEYADVGAAYADDAAEGEPAAEGEAGDQPVAREPLDLAADARYAATGKRKTAVARVILRPGDGVYTINGRHLDQFFPRVRLQRMAQQPLETAGYNGRMDVVARIHGGGVSAQAGALRHGIARALVEADPNLRVELKRRGFLTRDPREKERKKAGLKKARKRPQFSKR